MEDQLLGTASAGEGRDLVLQLLLRVEVVVSFILDLHGVAQCTGGSRDDRDLLYRCRVLLKCRHQCMTDLMVGNDQLLLIGHHVVLLLVTGDDDLDRLLEIRLDHALTTGTYCTKCCLVDDIGQLRTTRAGGCLCDGTEIDIFRHLDTSGVHLQDVDTALEIRKLDRYTTVETARTKQCRIQGIRLVRRRQDDDGLRAVEAVHLRQELVQGLLTLIVATHRTVATLLTDGIDLIDEDDARRLFLRLLEEITYLRRTHADEHLDELGAGDGEERNVRLTGHGLGK